MRFKAKAEAGRRRNDQCNEDVASLIDRLDKEGILISDALWFAWAKGCAYGKEHAEELKVFDK